MKSGRVTLEPGEEVGEHTTDHREEVVVVLKGSGVLLKGKEKVQLREGEVYFIGEDVLHNIKNESNAVLHYIYVVALFLEQGKKHQTKVGK